MIKQLEDQLKVELENANCFSSLELTTTEIWFWRSQCIKLLARNQALESECFRLKESTLLPEEVDDGK